MQKPINETAGDEFRHNKGMYEIKYSGWYAAMHIKGIWHGDTLQTKTCIPWKYLAFSCTFKSSYCSKVLPVSDNLINQYVNLLCCVWSSHLFPDKYGSACNSSFVLLLIYSCLCNSYAIRLCLKVYGKKDLWHLLLLEQRILVQLRSSVSLHMMSWIPRRHACAHAHSQTKHGNTCT